MQLNRIEIDGNYYYLPESSQLYKSEPVLKTPDKGDWYIYYSIWDFETGKWKPQKFYSTILNKKELLTNSRLRKRNGEGVRLAVFTILKEGGNPKTGTPISPLVDTPLEELLNHSNDPSPIPMLEDAISMWLKMKSGKDNPSKSAPENKENTETTYTSLFTMFKDHCEKEGHLRTRLDKITKHAVLKFFEARYGAGTIGDTTWNNQLGAIKAMFAHYSNKFEYKDVTKNIDRKENIEDSERFEPFTIEQVQAILDYFDNEKVSKNKTSGRSFTTHKLMAYMCRTIFYTFIRISELRRLKIKHVKDYKKGFLSLSVGITKTKKKIFNSLYIDPALVAEFEKLGWEEFFTDSKYDNYYVFTSDMKPSTERFSKSVVTAYFSRALSDLKINGGKHSMYSFKATGNIEAFKAGWDLFQISLQNRHTTTQQTETYLRKLKIEISARPRPKRGAF